jgi:2-methylcitrate dehydratase PrpD
MTLLQEFGQFIEASQHNHFSPPTLHCARRALLDWHGALIAGADSEAGSRLRDAYREEFGVGHSSVAGSQKKVFARAAAFMLNLTTFLEMAPIILLAQRFLRRSL